MKHLFIAILASVLSIACTTTPKIKKPQVWKVEKDGKVMHVFGMLDRGVKIEQLPESVLKLMDESEVIAVPLNIDDLRGLFKKLEDSKGHYNYQAKQNLEEVVGVKQFDTLVRFLFGDESNKAEFKTLENFKNYLNKSSSVVAFQLLHNSPRLKRRVALIREAHEQDYSFDEDTVSRASWIYRENFSRYRVSTRDRLDVQLGLRAGMAKKKVISLDEVSHQYYLHYLKELNTEMKLITEYGKKKGATHLFVERMFAFDEFKNAYLNGDQMAMSTKVLAKGDLHKRVFLESKHKRWLEKFEDIMSLYKKSFVAVDVAHFYSGESSLLRELKRNGYNVWAL